MFDKQIEDFIELSADLIPGVFEKTSLGKCEVHDYYAVIEFKLDEKLASEDILDMLEDNMEMTILYAHHASRSTDAGVTVCAFSDHSFNDNFAIHATTGVDGLVQTVMATLFFSVDVMMEHLRDDLVQHSQTGSFDYAMDEAELMAIFC
ncbi:MAG: hypothetical protein Q4B58_06230 [Bacteroidales bacterium]|nr:hypothetical protein [Bacteroidales bacterium]